MPWEIDKNMEIVETIEKPKPSKRRIGHARRKTDISKKQNRANIKLVPMPNPFSTFFKENVRFSRVWDLSNDPALLIPAFILFFVQTLIALMSIVLWPYGWILVTMDLMWQLVTGTWKEMKKFRSVSETIAHAMSIFIYFMFFFALAILCSPIIVILGLVALFVFIFRKKDSSESCDEISREDTQVFSLAPHRSKAYAVWSIVISVIYAVSAITYFHGPKLLIGILTVIIIIFIVGVISWLSEAF